MPNKKPKLHSTQEYLEVGEIREGIIIMRDGSLRMVMLASAINFSLKSEKEQNAIIFQYQNFLNSLNFPIQIVVQSRKIDLAPYLAKLRERLDLEENELLQIQIIDYMEFINRLIKIANIMDKKFFVIIPLTPPGLKQRSIFDKILHPSRLMMVELSEVEFKAYKEELVQRANVIISGLASLGIRTATLDTQQIVELLYATYNPEEATKEKLIHIEDLAQPVIGKQAEAVIIKAKEEEKTEKQA